MILAPCGVRMTSSSMRAAETPSVAGQYVSTANTMPALSSIGSPRGGARRKEGRVAGGGGGGGGEGGRVDARQARKKKKTPAQPAPFSLSKPMSFAVGRARA